MRAVLLFLSANPSGTAKLDLDEEYRAIDHEKTVARLRDAFDLRAVLAATIGDVRRKMAELRPAVVHFGGHGVVAEGVPDGRGGFVSAAKTVRAVRGELALKGEDGRAAPVPIGALAELFRIQGGSVRCVVL